jgi:hypothetical protein
MGLMRKGSIQIFNYSKKAVSVDKQEGVGGLGGKLVAMGFEESRVKRVLSNMKVIESHSKKS